MSDYDNWQLDALREECNKREIIINSKDGVKTLAARLRTYDRNDVVEKTDKAQALDVHNTQPGEFEDDDSMQNLSDSLGKLKLASDLKMKNMGEIPGDFEKVNYSQRENTPGALSFRERMELLHFERDLEREREAREIRREERRKQARFEERAFEVELERERAKTPAAFENSGKFVKVREMRETEDIDDYFRIFEMTAKTQRIPRSEWLGSLAPRLSEKAKSIFLEISGLDAYDYDKSLLRLPAAKSALDDMSEGTSFRRCIVEDGAASKNPEGVKKLILCSGKVYYDLIKERDEKNLDKDIAISRVEQLCPFRMTMSRKKQRNTTMLG